MCSWLKAFRILFTQALAPDFTASRSANVGEPNAAAMGPAWPAAEAEGLEFAGVCSSRWRPPGRCMRSWAGDEDDDEARILIGEVCKR